MELTGPMQEAMRAFHADDSLALRELLKRHTELRSIVRDSNVGAFDSPPIVNVRSRGMLDLLLEYGADINAKSRWWAGGFGLLHSAPVDLAEYAIQRGAFVDVHAAARLGMPHRVRELLQQDPNLVHARGGDGQTPLHFASTIEIAGYLLEGGADINARDLDHESTAAQWMLDERVEVAKFLVKRGCETDLLMAAALGDVALARKHLDKDPGAIRMRVSEEYFPMVGDKSGGTIYQWTLGWHVSAHQIAMKRGYTDVLDLLMERSPVEVKLINAAWLHDAEAVDRLQAENREIAKLFTPEDVRQTAHAARNNDTEALRLLLKAGLPVNSRGQHQATPLHWAAWHGNPDALRLILEHNPDLEDKVNDFQATPLGWAMHGSENGWHRKTGNYVETVEALLAAGVKPPDKLSGTPEVQHAIRKKVFTFG